LAIVLLLTVFYVLTEVLIYIRTLQKFVVMT